MRIYRDCKELRTELMRDVYEMGHEVQPSTMQGIYVKDDDNFLTKEIINYSYCLKTLDDIGYLFIDDTSRDWAEAELKERITLNAPNPGKAWLKRLEVWANLRNPTGKFDYTYSERISKSLIPVISDLKTNPNTRQAIISIWDPSIDPYNVGGVARVPCSIYYSLLLRGGKLHIVYNQRSCDIMTHFGNDVYLAFKLMEYIAEQIGAKPGYLYHNIMSLHSYKKDWGNLKQFVDGKN